MPELLNFRTKALENVPEGDVQAALSTGTHGWNRAQRIPVVAPDGTPGTIAPEDAAGAFGGGYKYDTLIDREERRKDAQYGDAPVRTFGEGAARGLTFGLSDVALRALGADEEGLRERKARNPGAEMAGEVTGIALPLVASLGSSTPLAAGQTASLGARALEVAGSGVLGAAKAGTAVERATAAMLPKATGTTAKLIADAIPKGAGSIVEGALYGSGQVVSDAALGDPDLNAQHALSKIGLSALLSGTVGASAPIVGRAVKALVPSGLASKAGAAASAVLDPTELENFAAQQAVKASGAMKRDFKRLGQQPGELTKVGTDALETGVVKAGDTLDSIYEKASAATDKAGQDVGDLLGAFDAAAARQKGAPTPNMGRVVTRSQSEIVDPLLKSANPDEVRLGKQFSTWLDEFNTINQGKSTTFQDAQQLRRSIDQNLKWDMSKPPDALTQQKRAFRSILEDEIESSADKLGKSMAAAGDLRGEYENSKRLYKSMVTIRDMAQDRIAAQDTNRMFSLTDYIGSSAGAGTGALLGGGPGAVMGFLTGFVNKALFRDRGNAILASGALRLAKLERAINSNKLAVQNGVKQYLQGTTGPRHILPPLATDVLDTKPGEPKKEAFQRKIDQIQELTANPAQMAANFAEGARGFAEVAPDIGAQLHVRAAQAVNYLAQTAPQNPNRFPQGITPRPYVPTDQEMASWLRRYQTANDPLTAIRAMQSGTLTREHIETLQAVYPAIYEQMKDAVVRETMNTGGETINYQRRLLLSRLFQVPLDPTMQPGFVQAMQMSFQQPDQTQAGPGGPAKSAAPGTPAMAAKQAGNSKYAEAVMTPTQRISMR